MIRSVSFLLTISVSLAASAADWPQWRGPNRDGVTTETIAPWKTSPPVLWERPIGEAHSSPIVARGRLYAMEKKGTSEIVLCLDAKTGKEIWKQEYHAPFSNVYGNGPRATPTLQDDKVVTLGARGDLYCFNALTGEPIWNVNLLSTFKATNLFFGTSGSPLVHQGMVLVMAGGPNAGVVALDLKTGKTIWTSQDDRASYASPILFGQGDQARAIFLTQKGLLSLRPTDGTPCWRHPLVTFNDENAVTPLALGDLVIASSVSYGMVAMKVAGEDARPVWQSKAASSYFSSPVAMGEEIYAVTGTPAVLKCLDARTGEELWKHGPVGLLHASMIVARDHLLLQCDTGLVILARPTRKGFEQLAKTTACGPGWVHPAFSDGNLYLRDAKTLKRLNLSP